MLYVTAEEVAKLLPYEECISLMREAMIALSAGRTRQGHMVRRACQGRRQSGLTRYLDTQRVGARRQRRHHRARGALRLRRSR